MNTNLLSNPFNITYPTAVQTSLYSQASFSKFDPSGRFVAAGCPDGSARVWDLDTKSTVRWLEGHVKAVTSVDWSRNSRYVLTSSKDWNVVVWDLASETDPPKRVVTVRFDAPIASASFHPRNSQILLVLLSVGEAYIVDLRKNHRGRTELCEPDDGDEDSRQRNAAITVARFDPSGKHVFLGTSAGYVAIFNSRTKTMVARHRIAGAGIIKGLDFTRNGRRLVTNSSDRTLRQFILPTYPSPTFSYAAPNTDSPLPSSSSSPIPIPIDETQVIEYELEPINRFNDPINKVAWHAMCFSPEGDWLAGGAADNATHKIYIWDPQNEGQFASALDGGREPLAHVHWHPTKPMIASTTNRGNILIWHCPTPERWGAFAGGFEEVDENVEYEEREDEFDIEDESAFALRKERMEEQPVDVFSFDDPPSSSTEQTNGHSTPHLNHTQSHTHLHPQHDQINGGSRSRDEDEDYVWADDDPDDDYTGWRLKVLMEEDEDMR
ncbi:hypothetical protein QCA50_001223 [Cerrena zonata]|uniref:WD40 repeat-like protein n=1 Tax=Cerrena zonata TaxID=2478898 RepID=A0AAW0H0J9_9APHY